MPIVVFTTGAAHAALLLSLLRRKAVARFGEGAEKRIRDMWAGVQDDTGRDSSWRIRIKVEDEDVLITTCVLHHSLDRYLGVSFDFLWKCVEHSSLRS
ncbi:hypothetical protein V1508DRAFT_442779 [Lipomyces doorenjongii]|uniref:uncharacterized protein n=1 Tax=Lipomyces doorenjongii TaxID=383834 RepID=UPI0034CD35CE